MREQSEKVYIKDKRGDYYKLDETGQLVRAQNKEYAYTFTEKDAFSRIGTGKRARFYTTETVAVMEYQEEFDYDAVELTNLQPESRYEHFGEMVERLVHEMSDVCLHIDEQREYLASELTRVDQKISDVMHYLEFNATNSTDYFKSGKMLKEFSCKRRKIKNDLDKIKMLKNTFMNNDFNVLVAESMRQMDDIKTRKYFPRQLPELFGMGN